ncbi:hypothetical protein QWZ13_05785 [Reinekea marina]|uniref:Uncharacterized protein n=1 Tax=Reinekea marina TaxID=1310421 RepID=A0ABV7WMZ9_9GAMM|nr:hypothetical protein [Reinekea marina]MDN3648416.1 hypothetical protein [Reinekea marina]
MTNTVEKSFEAKVKRTTKILAIATLGWVLTTALVTFGPEFLWQPTWITFFAICINSLAGVGMIIANIKHISSLDELQRRIQMIAMGISLGVAVVFGLSLSMMETSGAWDIEFEISHLVVLISFTYMGTLITLNKRYE